MSTPLGSGARGAGISPTILFELRRYMIDLTRGRLSTTGLATSTEQDIELIFDQYLPEFVTAHGSKQVPVVIWAHGGLVDEASGIRIAHRQAAWWLSNGVYPLFFTWEAGFGDALNQLFASWVGSRGIMDDAADRVAEWTARHLGGSKIWGAMKSSAELASTPGGGARIVAEHLGKFVQDRPDAVRLHAVGHSAGSIFHRYFLPEAVRNQARFESLTLLAPAIRSDEFKAGLAPLLGNGLSALSMFTMNRAQEEADVCAAGSFVFYHQSLLLLIHAALEDSPNVSILGLEECVQADPELWRMFGPGHDKNVDIVYSPTDAAAPRIASSTSTSHGGFDDDPLTMESLALRITGSASVTPFPIASDRAADVMSDPTGVSEVGPIPSPQPSDVPGKHRRALCVGINAYPPPHDLHGCVGDARAWADALTTRGFHTELLLDTQATRQAIMERLVDIVGSSRAGDVIVFQYSGHGTSVTDIDGDEPYDEALCPVDYASGALLVDDDLRKIFTALPDGVNLTCFLDSCHSATGTRDAFSLQARSENTGPGIPRFIEPDAALEAAHRAFRLRTGTGMAPPAARGTESMREVTFSACLEDQLAYEIGGRGAFSTVAVPLLALDGLDNREFQNRIDAAFGPDARQQPYLDDAPSADRRRFLEPTTTATGKSETDKPPVSAGLRNRSSTMAAFLRTLADVITEP